MANNTGIIKLYGSIGGLNFYQLKGTDVVRTAGGGFNGKAIRKSPKMVRVRENMSEFGMVSRMNKRIRIALHPLYLEHKDGTLHHRLQTLLTNIKGCDAISERGHRTVGNGFATPIGQHLLEHFAFTPEFKGQIPNGVFNSGDLSYIVSNLNVNPIVFPTPATHIELSLSVLNINFEETAASLTQSAPVFIGNDLNSDGFTLQIENVPEVGLNISLLFIRYYQEIGGEKYVLKDQGLMGIRKLGISGL